MNRHFLKGLAACALAGSVAWIGSSDLLAGRASAEQAPRAPRNPLATRAEKCAVRAIPAAQLAAIDESIASIKDSGGNVVIPVYWHVVTDSTGRGNVTGLIADQMNVLRDSYAGSKFAFDVKAVEVVGNDDWFFAAAGSAEEVAMKTALRKGGPDVLNIYTTNGDVYLGWATMPHDYKKAPAYDGVVLWWAALPGTGLEGTSTDEPDGVLTYDQGDTGTHEVGHWLGLEHTFGDGDGACEKNDDKIKDTPAEAIPQFFCVQRDSCTGKKFAGSDPITNFMDYVDDVCMDNFTSDQTARMRKHWHAFRDKTTRQ